MKQTMHARRVVDIRLKTVTHCGRLQFYDIDPEVGFHVMQEINQGQTAVHFEDKHERPVTIDSLSIRSVHLVKNAPSFSAPSQHKP